MSAALLQDVYYAFLNLRLSFWSDSFWLPLGLKWTDLKRTRDMFIPDVRDLWIAAPIAVALFLARIFWER